MRIVYEFKVKYIQINSGNQLFLFTNLYKDEVCLVNGYFLIREFLKIYTAFVGIMFLVGLPAIALIVKILYKTYDFEEDKTVKNRNKELKHAMMVSMICNQNH